MDASIFWAWYDWIPSVVGSTMSLLLVWYSWRRRHYFKRLRYAYLAVGACVLGKYSLDELGVLIIERTKYGSIAYETWIIPTLLAIFFTLLGLVTFGFAVFWSSKWYQFRRMFGESPPTSDGEQQQKQKMVSDRLHWLARWLRQAFDFEGAVLREISKDSETGTDKYPELEETKKWIATAKKRFWLAHNIASHHSFEVHPSYKDYLPAKTGKVAR